MTTGRVFLLALCLVMHPFMQILIYADVGTDEVDALITFKQALQDPDNVTQSWVRSSGDPCTWFHVSCENPNSNRVTSLLLGNCNLSGSLVPELGNLQKLQRLELYNNRLSGSIPPELGNLTELTSLDLYNNTLTGFVPYSLGKLKKLTVFRLNDNHLGGCFPPSVLDLFGAGTLTTINLTNNLGLCITDKPTKECPCPNL